MVTPADRNPDVRPGKDRADEGREVLSVCPNCAHPISRHESSYATFTAEGMNVTCVIQPRERLN